MKVKILLIAQVEINNENISDLSIDFIDFSINDVSKAVIDEYPCTFVWDEKAFGKYKITARAYIDGGSIFDSKEFYILNF